MDSKRKTGNKIPSLKYVTAKIIIILPIIRMYEEQNKKNIYQYARNDLL